jgi:hypothetical protein
VGIEATLREFRPLGNIFHAGRGEAMLRKFDQRCAEYLLYTNFGRKAAMFANTVCREGRQSAVTHQLIAEMRQFLSLFALQCERLLTRECP